MGEFSPDILKGKNVKLEFKNTEDAVRFILDLMDHDKKSLQEVFKKFFELNIQSYMYVIDFLILLCAKLEDTYGLKIDFNALFEAARSNVDQDWSDRKEKNVELRELFRQLDDVFKKDSI